MLLILRGDAQCEALARRGWLERSTTSRPAPSSSSTLTRSMHAQEEVDRRPRRADRRDSSSIVRDPDVLDTWFSSGIWPLGTLGWPEDTPELARYYPTCVLVTGFDILFFWVARMMMMQLALVGEVPFRDVYIHAARPRREGQEDVEVARQHPRPARAHRRVRRRRRALHPDRDGGDGPRHQALPRPHRRLPQLRHQALERRPLRRDERLPPRPGASTRAPSPSPPTGGSSARPAACARRSTPRSTPTASTTPPALLYAFVWGKVCDWYVELAKPLLDGDGAAETRATMAWVLDQCLILMHPFMPFITEALWGQIAARPKLLAHADWPDLRPRPDRPGRRRRDELGDRPDRGDPLGPRPDARPRRRPRHPGHAGDRPTTQAQALARNRALVARLARVERFETRRRGARRARSP